MAAKKRQVKNVTPVTINGEEMFLKYNVFAMRKLKELGVDFSKFTDGNAPDFDDIAKILYCGLVTYDPTLTVDEVSMLVDVGDLQELTGKIMEAMQSINPKN